mmetsp:Transcript_42438/g.89111  ORF Transcript_42438/g.89111 Transcript_42438/m.89111 type:complete len:233 (-) Transcript_42438:122-820(-)
MAMMILEVTILSDSAQESPTQMRLVPHLAQMIVFFIVVSFFMGSFIVVSLFMVSFFMVAFFMVAIVAIAADRKDSSTRSRDRVLVLVVSRGTDEVAAFGPSVCSTFTVIHNVRVHVVRSARAELRRWRSVDAELVDGKPCSVNCDFHECRSICENIWSVRMRRSRLRIGRNIVRLRGLRVAVKIIHSAMPMACILAPDWVDVLEVGRNVGIVPFVGLADARMIEYPTAIRGR